MKPRKTLEIVHFLKTKVPLFAGFTVERLGEIVGGSHVASFEANEAIVHHGAEATHFLRHPERHRYLPRSLARAASRQTLGRLEAGETFGEAALMTGDTMIADFIAESRCEVLSIPVSLFQSIIVAEPRRGASTFADDRRTLQAGDGRSAKAAAALRRSDDPMASSSRASGRRKSSSSTAALRRSNTAFTTRRTNRARRAARLSASHRPERGMCIAGREAK